MRRRNKEYTVSVNEHVALYPTAVGRLVVKCLKCGESLTFSAPRELGPRKTWCASDQRALQGVRNFDAAHEFCG